MNELSHEARSLLAVARNATLPAGPRRQNIKHKVLLRVAAVAAASAGAGLAGASSLAGKLVVTGIALTMATGGAIGVWKWHASSEAGSSARNARSPSARHDRPQPVRAAASGEPALPRAEAPTFLLGEPPAPMLKGTARERPLAPAAPPAMGSRGTRAEEAPRAEDAIPRVQPTRVPANPLQPPAAQPSVSVSTSVPAGGQAASIEAWPSYPTTPLSASAHALPSPAQQPAPHVVGPGRGHSTFQDRQPMLASPSPAGGTLEYEVAELRRAQEALRNGQPRLALRLLVEYDRTYPAGSLREERAAIAAIATCQADPGPEARARAQAFLRDAPQSLLAKRVRAACLQQGEAPK